MNNRLLDMPAYQILQRVSLLLVVVGSALLYRAVAHFLNVDVIRYQPGMVFVFSGLLVFLLGVFGPLRIIRKGILMPVEIKHSIVVQAIVLPLVGASSVVAGFAHTPAALAWAFFLAGGFVLFSAWAGFYVLSTKLPRTFYLGEMLNVIRSAAIAGDKDDSPAQREFMRWTKGLRDGVPIGEPAPDGAVTTLQGETVALASFFNNPAQRLWVLNFGSYSCPHHRKRLDELQGLMEKWQGAGVHFLTVYIAEAHPSDGWEIAHQYEHDAEYTQAEAFRFLYAKNLDDRARMARWLVEKKKFNMPLVLDSMHNELLHAYNAWPIRLYIIDSGRVVYCGAQGPFGYEPKQLERTLQTRLQRKQSVVEKERPAQGG